MSYIFVARRLLGLSAAVMVCVAASSAANVTPPRHGPIEVRRNPDGTPQRGLRNQWTSTNWSGYEVANYQTGQKYTQAQLTWTVPTVTYGQSTDSTSSSEYSANWVGIGGFCENRLCARADKTLIQLGTEQDVSPSGATQYYAWYEMLPAAETPLGSSYPVNPGDTITATLACSSACGARKQNWTLTMTDQTAGWSWTGTFLYGSSMLSAEWIEEAPYSGGVLPLADFGTASFSATGGVNNGQTPSLSLSTNGIQMQDSWGQTSSPSATDSPLADFNACWGYQTYTSCATP
jgi:Peptidase A4 family